MNRSAAGLILLALSTTSLSSLAGDDEYVKRPYIEPGDCWSYHAKNLNQRGPIEDYELCVTFVDYSKDVIVAVARVKNDGREIDASFTSEWGTATSITGRVFNPPSRGLQFPLHIGDKYSSESTFTEALTGPFVGKVRWDMEVVGWEDVTVPAGTFHALKVEFNGFVQRLDQFGVIKNKGTIWYCPEVNRQVKFVFSGNNLSEELTEYHLNK